MIIPDHVTWRHEPRLTTSLFGDIHQWNILKYSSARQTVYLCLQENACNLKINQYYINIFLNRNSGPKIWTANLFRKSGPKNWTEKIWPKIWNAKLAQTAGPEIRIKNPDWKSRQKFWIENLDRLFGVKDIKSEYTEIMLQIS